MAIEIKLQPPQKSTLVEAIIEQLVEQIRDGRLQPGNRLPSERQLISMLGVSRSSVRESLQGLAAMGLVEIRQGEGTFVKQTTANYGIDVPIDMHPLALQKDLRIQLNNARFHLEIGIITDACKKIAPSSASMITQALEAYYKDRDNYPQEINWRIHDRIHLSIAQATGNRFLVQMLQSLLDLVPSSLREGGVLFGTPEDIQENFLIGKEIHYELCNAIVKGEEPSAREWMKRHAQQEDEIIKRYYRSTEPELEENIA